MSLSVLVRRNVLDPVRSRSIWVVLGVFTLIFGLLGWTQTGGFTPGVAFVTAQAMSALAPIVALGFTYDAIAGPRQSGSLRVLLSYPYTRRELLLGTLIGRILVVGLGVAVGVVVASLSTLVFGGSVDFVAILKVLLLSLLLSTTIVGLGMGISASVRTGSRAAILSFGAFVLFYAFWTFLTLLLRYVFNGFSFRFGPTKPEWVQLWNQLNPINAFRTGLGALVEQSVSGAFYHAIWFSVLVLVGWFVLSTLFGVLRFDRTDL